MHLPLLMLSIQQKFRFEILEIPLTQWNESTKSKGTVPYDRNFRNFGLNEKRPVCVSMCQYVCMSLKK